MAKKALGKGLGAIISSSSKPIDDLEIGISKDSERIVKLDVDKIFPNPDQPRINFDESEIKGLAVSIKSVGLIQPIVVREVAEKFTLVVGERRLRATKFAGLKRITAVIIKADEVENLTLALIENIQRTDLNPIEEAEAYKVLVNRFNLKQQDIAKQVGKERATISNSLRLLNLPDEIKAGLSEGKINTGHAKVLLSVSGKKQKELYREIIEKALSVRALENIANDKTGKSNLEKSESLKDPQIRKMEEELISILGTKVEIKHSGNKGKIEINYYSLDDFERIVDLMNRC